MDPERHLKHQASLLDCRLSNDASIPIKQIKTTYQLGERRKKFCFVRTEKKIVRTGKTLQYYRSTARDTDTPYDQRESWVRLPHSKLL